MNLHFIKGELRGALVQLRGMDGIAIVLTRESVKNALTAIEQLEKEYSIVPKTDCSNESQLTNAEKFYSIE